MARVLTNRLTAYQLAGARLTGCRHGLANGNDVRILTTPNGRTFEYRSGTIGDPGNREATTRYGGIYPTLGDFLDDWQPDMTGSASRQHYIDTGLYLPVGVLACEAIGAADDPGHRPEIESRHGNVPDPDVTQYGDGWGDALDEIRVIIDAARGRAFIDPTTLDTILARIGR